MRIVRGANTISAIYIIAGILWIFFSDRIPVVNSVPALQTVKGVSYVILTGIILWLFLRRNERKNRKILEELENATTTVSKTAQQLTDEQNLLRTVIDNLPDYIYVKDLNGKTIIANKAFLRQLGRSAEEVLGKTDFDIFPQQFAEKYTDADFQAATKGEPLVFEHDYIANANGKSLRILTTKVPLKNQKDDTVAVVNISQDITAIYKKQLHDEISLKIIDVLGNGESFGAALTHILEIISGYFKFMLAEAWLVMNSELQLAAIWKQDPNNSFHNNHQTQYMPGVGLPGVTLATGNVQIWDNVIDHPNFTRSHNLSDEKISTGIGIPLILNGEPIAVFTFLSEHRFGDHADLRAILEQISTRIVMHLDRKKHETEIQELNDEITNLLETTNDGFYSLNDDWTVSYWNAKAEVILQMTRESILGKSLWETYPNAKTSELFPLYHKAMQTKVPDSLNMYFEPLDKWFEINVYPSNSGLSVFFKDITENYRLNQELQQRLDELAVSNAELEQFAYIASHDMQEPLRMVTGFLTQLEKKYTHLLDDKGKQYIGFAVDGAVRMRRLILDLLEYSKVGKGDFKIELFDVNDVIIEIQALNQTLISEENATFLIGPLPTISGAKSLIQQLFQNLIVNALKYRRVDVDPVISISGSDQGSFWQFAVSDNGIGIEQDYFERVFVIFQRLHSKEEYSGTGIGLAICKKIVENHGGRIWLESEHGKGSTFYFTIKK